MSIRFDGQKAMADLVIALRKDLLQLQQEIINESAQRMNTTNGKAGLSAEEITEVVGYLSAAIIGDAWAIMDEWGTGSKMDTTNPALEDYRKSDMWNPARPDNTIRTRPNTDGQRDIFGNKVKGRGAGGFDLERAGKVMPQPPSHAVKTAMRWLRTGRMKEKIQETIRLFPFGQYFIVDDK